jgi:hypothetical protein
LEGGAKTVYYRFTAALFKLPFILDYLPISIVYCPPEQDMSASITIGEALGTHLTMGTQQTRGRSSGSESGGKIGFIGREDKATGSAEVSSATSRGTDSRSLSNSSTGIYLQGFRQTTVTADNRQAIGRSYWGPLGDLFVIGFRSRWKGDFVGDGTFVYVFEDMDRILIVPAHKLLRPMDDEEIKAIPPFIRRQLLAMDPFIKQEKLPLFIPDSGAQDLSLNLADAVDPTASPTTRGNVELIGTWHLNVGSAVEYRISDEIELRDSQGEEMSWTTTGSQSSGGGIGGSLGPLSLEVGSSKTSSHSYSIQYQSSLETTNRLSKSASCYLIRNQNATDLWDIEIYYDKLFSSLMFRLMPTVSARLVGEIKDIAGEVIEKVPVELFLEKMPDQYKPPIPPDPLPFLYRVRTSASGRYEFTGLHPGEYTLRVGGKSVALKIPSGKQVPNRVVVKNVEKVRRVIDLQKAPTWEVQLAFGVPDDDMHRLRSNIETVLEMKDLQGVLGFDNTQFANLQKRLKILLPRTPLNLLRGIKQGEIKAFNAAGIESVQKLWTRGKTKAGRKELARQVRITETRIANLLTEFVSKRPIFDRT